MPSGLAMLEDVNGQPLSRAPSAPRVSPSGRPRRQPRGGRRDSRCPWGYKSRLTLF
jgi:hypothetical protein